MSLVPKLKSIIDSFSWPNLDYVPISWEGKHLAFSACMAGEGPAFHQDPKVKGSSNEGKGIRCWIVKYKDKCSFSNYED